MEGCSRCTVLFIHPQVKNDVLHIGSCWSREQAVSIMPAASPRAPAVVSFAVPW